MVAMVTPRSTQEATAEVDLGYRREPPVGETHEVVRRFSRAVREGLASWAVTEAVEAKARLHDEEALARMRSDVEAQRKATASERRRLAEERKRPRGEPQEEPEEEDVVPPPPSGEAAASSSSALQPVRDAVAVPQPVVEAPAVAPPVPLPDVIPDVQPSAPVPAAPAPAAPVAKPYRGRASKKYTGTAAKPKAPGVRAKRAAKPAASGATVPEVAVQPKPAARRRSTVADLLEQGVLAARIPSAEEVVTHAVPHAATASASSARVPEAPFRAEEEEELDVRSERSLSSFSGSALEEILPSSPPPPPRRSPRGHSLPLIEEESSVESVRRSRSRTPTPPTARGKRPRSPSPTLSPGGRPTRRRTTAGGAVGHDVRPPADVLASVPPSRPPPPTISPPVVHRRHRRTPSPPPRVVHRRRTPSRERERRRRTLQEAAERQRRQATDDQRRRREAALNVASRPESGRESTRTRDREAERERQHDRTRESATAARSSGSTRGLPPPEQERRTASPLSHNDPIHPWYPPTTNPTTRQQHTTPKHNVHTPRTSPRTTITSSTLNP